MHCAPQDSVCVFKDIKAKKALAMHWGYVIPVPVYRCTNHLIFIRTWVLSYEPVLEPIQRLKEECAKAGLEEGVFTECEIGETTIV